MNMKSGFKCKTGFLSIHFLFPFLLQFVTIILIYPIIIRFQFIAYLHFLSKNNNKE